jgi:phosphate starvation-inducible PhoH-like protein
MSKKRFETGVLLGHIELTEKQQEFHKIMTNYNTRVVFLSGPAGSSKSFLSVYSALDLYNKDKRRTITYLRTVIESASKGIGFLKGDMDQKLSPYLRPLEEKICDLLNEQEKDMMKRQNVLSGEPVNFVRGQDWKHKVVIADEMQNATIKELLTVMTRINDNTKLYICGDKRQSDINNSGFEQLFDLFNDEVSREQGIHCCEFDHDDIMRDPVVSYVIKKIDSLRN